MSAPSKMTYKKLGSAGLKVSEVRYNMYHIEWNFRYVWERWTLDGVNILKHYFWCWLDGVRMSSEDLMQITWQRYRYWNGIQKRVYYCNQIWIANGQWCKQYWFESKTYPYYLSTINGIQLQYNLLCREVEWELIPAANEGGTGILAWSPFKRRMVEWKVY